MRFSATTERLGVRPDRSGHDADRLPAGAGAPLGGHHRGAAPRQRALSAGGRGGGLVGRGTAFLAVVGIRCRGSSSATSGSRRPTARSWSTARTTRRGPPRRRPPSCSPRAVELLPPLLPLHVFQRGAVSLPPDRQHLRVRGARAVDHRRRDHARADEPDPERVRPGAHVVPVPGQLVAHDGRAPVDLQAPARLRGGDPRRGSCPDRPRVPRAGERERAGLPTPDAAGALPPCGKTP